MVKQQKVAKTASNLFLLGQFLGKIAIFCCFDVCSVRPPQTFQVQAKISTVQPVFPDYLSVSCDYVYTKLQKQQYKVTSKTFNIIFRFVQVRILSSLRFLLLYIYQCFFLLLQYAFPKSQRIFDILFLQHKKLCYVFNKMIAQ